MTRKQKTVTKVLELKGYTQEQLKLEVKKARDAYHHEKDKLDSLEEELKVHHDEFILKQSRSSIGIRDMDLFYLYFEHLDKLVEQQKKCVLVRQLELDEKMKAMHEAYKEQRLMEILHGRIAHEELRVAIQGAQKEMDYQFLSRRARR